MTDLALCTERPTASDVIALLRAQDEEYAPLYPPELNYTVPVDELDRPDLHFLVARDANGVAIGCGGLLVTPEFGELKRIYVAPAIRGRRFAERIVAGLETLARELGLRLLRLETGLESPAALRLYERLGYHHIGAFPPYEENGSSVFMEKRLP